MNPTESRTQISLCFTLAVGDLGTRLNLTLTIVHKTKKTNKLYYTRDDPVIYQIKAERTLSGSLPGRRFRFKSYFD